NQSTLIARKTGCAPVAHRDEKNTLPRPGGTRSRSPPWKRNSGRKCEREIGRGEGEIGIIGRIKFQLISPSIVHVFYFGLEALILPHGILKSAAGRFVMIKLCIGCVDNPITTFSQAQTKIDIVESDL